MRWIAGLVSAVIAFVVVGLIAQLVAAQLRNQALVDVSGAFASCFAFVFVGASIAPSPRRGRIVFAVLVVLLPLASIAIHLFAPAAAADQAISQPIASVAGAAVAFLLLRFQVNRAGKEWGWTAEQSNTVAASQRTGGRSAAIAKAAEIQAAQVEALRAAGIDTDVEPEVGKLIRWDQIIRHVFRVMEFDRHGTLVMSDGEVRAQSPTEPYGYLRAESPIMTRPIRMPIVHRDDFLLATHVYDDAELSRAVTDESELLITYAPRKVLPGGLSGTPDHCLHYVLCPRGTLERYYPNNSDGDRRMARPEPEKLFGPFVYQGQIRVGTNTAPAL